MRWVTRRPPRFGSGNVTTAPTPSEPCPTGRTSTTSPRSMLGAIEPPTMRVGRQPINRGSVAQSTNQSTPATTVKPIARGTAAAAARECRPGASPGRVATSVSATSPSRRSAHTGGGPKRAASRSRSGNRRSACGQWYPSSRATGDVAAFADGVRGTTEDSITPAPVGQATAISRNRHDRQRRLIARRGPPIVRSCRTRTNPTAGAAPGSPSLRSWASSDRRRWCGRRPTQPLRRPRAMA